MNPACVDENGTLLIVGMPVSDAPYFFQPVRRCGINGAIRAALMNPVESLRSA